MVNLPEKKKKETLADRVEKLSAQMEAFGKLRESLDMRISMLNERIGELRAMVLRTEKDMMEIRAKTERATGIIEELDPSKIMGEIRRMQARVETLAARIDATDAKLDAISSELREVRREIGKFRGVESVLSLSEEVRADLTEMEKIAADVRRQADRVMAIFAELRDRMGKTERFVARLEALEDSTKSLNKGLSELAPKVEEALARIEELRATAKATNPEAKEEKPKEEKKK